jgi:hypothetical protein
MRKCSGEHLSNYVIALLLDGSQSGHYALQAFLARVTTSQPESTELIEAWLEVYARGE